MKTTAGDCSDLYAKFSASRSYIDAVLSKTNEKSKQQSVAGLRALLFLLEKSGEDPTTLILERDDYGKPHFKNNDLQFSISHSGEMAVCALSEKSVGVDIEELREVKNAEDLSARFFSESEKRYVAQSKDKAKAFLEVWTKKESYLKMQGSGMTGVNLAEIDTSRLACHTYERTLSEKRYVISVVGDEPRFIS